MNLNKDLKNIIQQYLIVIPNKKDMINQLNACFKKSYYRWEIINIILLDSNKNLRMIDIMGMRFNRDIKYKSQVKKCENENPFHKQFLTKHW